MSTSIFNYEEFESILDYIVSKYNLIYDDGLEDGKIYFFDLNDDNDFLFSFKYNYNLFCYDFISYYYMDDVKDNYYIDYLLDIDNIIKKWRT